MIQSLYNLLCRSFTNIGKEEGLLQVIISGGVHDMNDISFLLLQLVKWKKRTKFEDVGFKFNAGI